MSAAKINLSVFCAKEPARYDIEGVFVVNGHLTATDGNILVRVPADKLETTDKKIPNVKEIFNRSFTKTDPIPIVAPGWSNKSCRDCNGTGILHVECTKCGALISVGRGLKCDVCKGSKYEYDNPKIDGKWFAGRYLAMIAYNLPSPRIVAFAADCFRFEFDGGEGLLSYRRTKK